MSGAGDTEACPARPRKHSDSGFLGGDGSGAFRVVGDAQKSPSVRSSESSASCRAHFAGILKWNNQETGPPRAEIGFEVTSDTQTRLQCDCATPSMAQPRDYRVWLEAWPCHYGGRRWWWICPVSGRRATKLLLPPGATVFAHRRPIGSATKVSGVHPSTDRTQGRGGSFDGSAGHTTFRAVTAAPAKTHVRRDL